MRFEDQIEGRVSNKGTGNHGQPALLTQLSYNFSQFFFTQFLFQRANIVLARHTHTFQLCRVYFNRLKAK